MSKIEIKSKKAKVPFYSIALFVLVLVSSIWLYIYNLYLQDEIWAINKDIIVYKTNIKELKKDEKLQVYTLIEENKKILNEMEKRSKITNYINAVEKISVKMWLEFGDFNYSDGKITTDVVAKTKSLAVSGEDVIKNLAYVKVRDFIKKYRKDQTALFDLGFINSFNWTDEISDTIEFSVVFTIK